MGINKKGEKESGLISLVAFIKWIKIFLAPTLLFGFIGFAVNYNANNITIAILGYLIIIIGLVVGVLLAEYVRKKHGIIEFDSRIYSSDDVGNCTDYKKKD